MALNGVVSSSIFQDDTVENKAVSTMTADFTSFVYGRLLIVFARSAVAGLSMHGSFVFNKYLVGISVVYYSLGVVSMQHDLSGIVIIGLFLYPHVLLVKYIHNGIMSRENYPFEEQSCCCVSPNTREIETSQE